MRLKELRIQKKLNMRQVAHKLNIAYTTYFNYEKEKREPNSEMLILLADFFDVTVDYLIGRTEFQNNSNAYSETQNTHLVTNAE
ncbi:MAG: helix-turn-helix transcriptional regulator [Clostridia bacterium]|nr:helix-turn-helix transcriptional regulator [Clostridia bacterium]